MQDFTIDRIISTMPKRAQKEFLVKQTSSKGKRGNLFKFCSQDKWQDASLRAANAFFVEIGEKPHIKNVEKIGYGLIALAGQNPHYDNTWERKVWEKNPPHIIKALKAAVIAAGNSTLSIRNFPNYLRPVLTQSNPEQAISSKSVDTQKGQLHRATQVEEDLAKCGREIEDQGYFDPKNEDDARERILRSIVQRAGQARFRKQLLKAYSNRCAITECDLETTLEAAHIIPYKGEHTNDVQNGLLLRADIHILFDLGKLSINPENYCVMLANDIRETLYSHYHGKQIRLPKNDWQKPNKEALDDHFKKSLVWQAY